MNKGRSYLQHNLAGTVIKTDKDGKPATAGDLGMSRRETLEHLSKHGGRKQKRTKVKRVTPAPVQKKQERKRRKLIKTVTLNRATDNELRIDSE